MFAVIARQSEFETEWKPTVQKKIEKGLVKP
jgi:hypothetical protein